MLALLGGLGAALCWATATMTSSRASRSLTSTTLLGAQSLAGLLVTLPFLVLGPQPHDLDRATVGWLVVSGAGNLVGLLFIYAALRIGQVGIVAPIVSTEGALAAVFALLAGEPLAATSAAALAVIAVGVVLAGRSESDEQATAAGRIAHPGRATALALAAATCFGASIYAAGRNADALPLAWATLPPRALAVAFVAAPALVRRKGRFGIPRRTWPLVVAVGVSEVLGFCAFTLGARHGIAVSAVVGSQFATLSAVGAFVLFRERISRLQVTGVATVVVGVAVLAALQA